MKMNFRFVTAPFALALTACVQEPTIPKVGDQPITLTMVLPSTTFRVGRPDTIHAVVTNLLNQQAEIRFNTNCQIVVSIRNAAGTLVVPSDGRSSCAPLLTSLVLPPESSVTQTFIWAGTTNFSPPGSPTALPPGSYFVSATLDGTNYSTFAPAIRIELTNGAP